MSSIIQALKSLKMEVIKVSILHSILDTSILILAVNFILFLLGLDSTRVIISLIAGCIFAVFDFIFRFKDFRLQTFEKYNPEVSEMLRTAHDNVTKDNEVVKVLFQDVIKKLRFSSTYQLIQHKRAMVKIAVLFVLSLSTMTFTVIQLQFPQLISTPVENLSAKIEAVNILNDNIYGEKSNIEIGERELQLILSSSTNINLNQIKDIDEVDFQRENFPVEVAAQAEATSEEEIPQDFELIKNYNLRIRNL